jgi:hypothetical protein
VFNVLRPYTFATGVGFYAVNNLFIGPDQETYVFASWHHIGGRNIFLNNVIMGWDHSMQLNFEDNPEYIFMNNIIQGFNPGEDWNVNHSYNLYTGKFPDTPGQGEINWTGGNINDLFLDKSGNNFSLKEGSPAIDKGADISALLAELQAKFPDYNFYKDIDGNSRPKGAAWDIGAYEYVPGLLLNSPNGGGNWKKNSTQTIRWTANCINGDVEIALYKSGVSVQTIQKVPASDRTYSWTVPNTLDDDSDYKVRIYQGLVEDYSNDFFSINTDETTYNVLFSAGPGGTLNGDADQTVTPGGSTSAVTAVPNSGYRFDRWSGDISGTTNPLTISDVQYDMSITAQFAVSNNPQPQPDGGGGGGGGGGGCFITAVQNTYLWFMVLGLVLGLPVWTTRRVKR